MDTLGIHSPFLSKYYCSLYGFLECFFTPHFRLAITKLDILDDFDEIKVGIQYKLNGKVIEHYPASEAELINIEVGRPS